MKPLFDHIYKVSAPCEITDRDGNLLYVREKKKDFVIPLTGDIKVLRGRAQFLGTQPNFYRITPPALPQGWNISFSKKPVSRRAEIFINGSNKTAAINLDTSLFNDKTIPEGCKVFMVFHEIGHLIYGPAEEKCDEFAFWHSLYAGVSPFLCYVAIRAFMPAHYAYRIEHLGKILEKNPQLKAYSDDRQ